ncbi:MAG: ATP-dependent helicase HepA [Cellvibrionaceae bacterium]|jgi:ATP-dependent helicase HepA
MMHNPQIGQRWLVDTDASLGLGMVVAIEGRRFTLEFPATGESRQYAIKNAPLTRAVFSEGETIETEDGNSHQVARVETINDLLIYLNKEGDPIPETKLASSIQLNHPLKRLLASQLDKPSWFDVREQLAQGHQQWLRSGVEGLLGARITLTPHQLYVAQSATSRTPVRILLADEVGLGKTIEAGLILQRLILQNTVSRTLVLVPEALCVQWFVELLRCFAIYSSLVDEETDCQDSRVFIAPHNFIDDPRVLESDRWDMVIVDEAHHFDLVDGHSLGQKLKALSLHTTHLLLLSATPERLGLESHFTRLQLLDSEKFYDFSEFEKAYEHYQNLASDLQALIDDSSDDVDQIIAEEKLVQLREHFDFDLDSSITKESLLELLLDTFGTGRMVYRNTRHGIAGFPKRKLLKHTIEGREEKLNWLKEFIKQHDNEKSLLITHNREEVLELKEWLYRKTGIDCPVFHEDMTLVERDRAAAYFADAEEGAPLLLCSEIGSEGRNFQFCHRLVCWDLPEHPDVLEQRIGRLDRIGQNQDIEIHICIDSTDAEQRLHWYHDVLSSVEQINPAAGVIHDKWYQAYLENQEEAEPSAVCELSILLEKLEKGRDRLLEINSCRQPQADTLVKKIQQVEADNNPQVLLENITDVLNLHYEQLDMTRFRLVPSDHMLVPMIPGIPIEGCDITFDRKTATAREDIEFVTWDHPLMQGLAEMIAISDLGVASVGLLPNKSLKPGMLFVEALFSLSMQSTYAKQAQPYLTESGLRVVVTDKNPSNLSKALPSAQLNQLVETASKQICKTVVGDYRQIISSLAEQAEALAASEMGAIIDESVAQCQERANLEVLRIKQLQQRNEAITDADVKALEQGYNNVKTAMLTSCKPIISAIRLLVTYKPDS